MPSPDLLQWDSFSWYRIKFRGNKKNHLSQEPQNHIHHTTTRITTDLSRVLETAVQIWPYCLEIDGEHIDLYTIYVYVY